MGKEPNLSWLPKKEIDFLHTLKRKIVSSKTNSKEDLLKKIAQVFSDKDYGMYEAIKQGDGLRYPSEIVSQRYCAEEALKNFLLATVLGLDPLYFATDNFKGRRMPHDVVLVRKNADSFYMIDWKNVVGVRLSERGLFSEDGSLISDNLDLISPTDLIERTQSHREVKLLKGTIGSPKMLSRESILDGEIETYFGYHKEKERFTITHFVHTIPFGVSYYRRKIIDTSKERDDEKEEFGLVRDRRGLSYTEIPTNIVHGQTRLNMPFMHNLTQAEQKAIISGSSYYHKKKGKRFLFDKETHKEMLKDLRKIAMKGDTYFLDFYRSLIDERQLATASQYLDFLAFEVTMNFEYKGDFRKAAQESFGVRGQNDLEKFYLKARDNHFRSFNPESKDQEIRNDLLSLL